MIRVSLAVPSAYHACFDDDIAVSDTAELNGCSRLGLSCCLDERLTVMDD